MPEASSLPPDDELLDSLVRQSLDRHPDLASMRAMVAAESSRAAMARSWMNPGLSLELMGVPNSFKFNADPATAFEIGVMQRIPFPGKLSRAGAAADARINAAASDLESARQEMAAMVAMNYYDLAALVRIDSLLTWGLALTEEMARAAEAMVAGGMAAQSDIHRARLESENWQLQIINNHNDTERARTVLSYAVGAQIDSPEARRYHLPEGFAGYESLPATTPEAVDASPSVLSAIALLRAAEAAWERARLDWFPDADLMLKYGLKPNLKVAGGIDPMTGAALSPGTVDQRNMISAGATFTLPIFSRGNQRAQIAEMQAMRDAAAARLADARLAKNRELQEIEASWQKNRERAGYIQANIVPRAEALYQTALADYQSGKTPFMELAQARMSLVMAEMELTMSRAETWSFYARWRAALGQLAPTDRNKVNE